MEVTTMTDVPHLEKSAIINVHQPLEKEEDSSPIHIEDVATTKTEPEPSESELPKSPHLLTLPRELRDIILSHISDLSPPPLNASRTPLPSLLRVNRQLRSEFAQIFYSQKLILAGGAPSPRYEKMFFDGFDPKHKGFVKRCHWLWDSYGTEEQAKGRARELDLLTGVREGVWTVGFIDPFREDGDRRGMARYVNAFGRERRAGEI